MPGTELRPARAQALAFLPARPPAQGRGRQGRPDRPTGCAPALGGLIPSGAAVHPYRRAARPGLRSARRATGKKAGIRHARTGGTQAARGPPPRPTTGPGPRAPAIACTLLPSL
ncbi:hypothetical protein ACFQ0G_03100 [Streptomyces chiangmaiensis]